MKIEIVVTIEPAGAALTLDVLRARLPQLGISVAESVGRGDVRFVGSIRVAVPGGAVELMELMQKLSAEYPEAVVSVTWPTGEVMRYQAGELGDKNVVIVTSSELERFGTPALPSAPSEAWGVFASFRIAEGRQPNLLRLLDAVIAPSIGRSVHHTPNALAIGFELEGTANSVAELLALIRFAWKEEGSLVETLVEIAGPTSVNATLRGVDDWLALERNYKPSSEAAGIVELVALPELLHIAGSHGLTWCDAEENLYGLLEDKLCSFSERRELVAGRAAVKRRSGGDLVATFAGTPVEIPRPEPQVVRRLHVAWDTGALFSDTDGRAERAASRLMVVDKSGVRELRTFTHVRSVDADANEAFVIADGPSGVRLFAVELASGVVREGRPWQSDEVPTDVEVNGTGRVAVTVAQAARSRVYLVERANLTYGRTLALPCVEPQIVGHVGSSLWITGMAPAPGSPRCDLFRVDVLAGSVQLLTAEIDVAAIDVVLSANGTAALLSTPRAVFVVDGHQVYELMRVASDERVTGMAYGLTSVVFVDGLRGPRILFGRQCFAVPLQAPGFAPRFL